MTRLTHPSRRHFLLSAAYLLGAAMTTSLSALAESVPGEPAVADTPPAPLREFRGVWLTTVQNLDWPSRRGLSAPEQKAELLALLDRAVALRLNAIVFQIRPSADAFYDSPLEPWSEYLTGQMGGNPGYDPLAFAVEEAHRRGLELHAWFNPFRVSFLADKTPAALNHLSRTHPEWVREYGSYLWLDPGEKAARDYVIEVITDVVRRYDVDGVHVDDYFYPYVEKDGAGHPIPFPDDKTWTQYQQGGGKLSRADWRRDNINSFVQTLYAAVKAAKTWVKVGISPFGIWRPGNPAQIKGLDAYTELYADSRAWLQNGWVDYLSPQLYWSIENPPQSYPALLAWWQSQNPRGRHLWPGLSVTRVGDLRPPEELVYQIKIARGLGADGNILFRMMSLVKNTAGVADALTAQVYQQQALVPASPWLASGPPPAPVNVSVQKEPDGRRTLQWTGTGARRIWLVQTRVKGDWITVILPAATTSLPLDAGVDRAAVTAVDRGGVASAVTVVGVMG